MREGTSVGVRAQRRKAVNIGTVREGSLEAERGRSATLGWTGFSGTCKEEQGHSLPPQVSDVLTPAAPRDPHGHLLLLLSSSPGRVGNQHDKQDQGHGFQAGHDLGMGGPGVLRATHAPLRPRRSCEWLSREAQAPGGSVPWGRGRGLISRLPPPPSPLGVQPLWGVGSPWDCPVITLRGP